MRATFKFEDCLNACLVSGITSTFWHSGAVLVDKIENVDEFAGPFGVARRPLMRFLQWTAFGGGFKPQHPLGQHTISCPIV